MRRDTIVVEGKGRAIYNTAEMDVDTHVRSKVMLRNEAGWAVVARWGLLRVPI